MFNILLLQDFIVHSSLCEHAVEESLSHHHWPLFRSDVWH
ncbi:hypothetical protein KPK_1468 [Klebsiella variicola]|uniref:Uncharacterized protein n=1 Tax=Klebsiella variicola (strain 342) TaxID=507522 RepID=B5XNV1_KLEV3|nr:hypothetical protein KPK_1468 [Klebsiella variicola]